MFGTHLRAPLAAGVFLLAACNGDDTSNSSESGTSSTSATTNATTQGSTASSTATATATEGSGTMSATGTSVGSSSESDTVATDPTTNPSTGPTSDPTTTDTTGMSTTGTSGSTTDMTSTSTTGVMEPMCGNGLLEEGEECDDGNLVDKDFCSNACTKVPCEEQEGMGNNDVLSYIWIANSGQGTVSKINTETAIEEGRYRVAGGSPSRTSVNLQGDVAVSSRDPGAVTKIIGNPDKCTDKDNDGMITTSTGPNDILAFGEDECVEWTITLNSPGYTAGPRATAWQGSKPDPDTCEYPTPNLWFGWRDGGGTAHIELRDGTDGSMIKEVTYPGWGSGYSPYGGAVNAAGDFFFVGLGSLPSLKVDAMTYEVTNLGNPPGGCKYGMTLDYKGDLWAGGSCGQAVYHWNHLDNTWTTIAGSGGAWVLGVMADANGNVWGAGSNPCRLVQLDIETKTYVKNNIALPGCSQPWGVSIDFEGNVWVVDKANKAFKVDPDTYEILAVVTGLVGPYTYSDMTGIALAQQINPQ